MHKKVFLLTPPFTQLNTPYPATAYLKGFLNTKNIDSFQADLGIEVILALFCKQGLQKMFSRIHNKDLSDNAKRMVVLQNDYINCIEPIIGFLQGKNPTLAHLICKRSFLPEASRFAQLDDLDWAFGNMGVQDRAKHLATLFLEDLADLIKECVDAHFGFSRYAERLGRTANQFDELYLSLQNEYSFIDELLIEKLKVHIQVLEPALVAISIPFPGNLYSALRCGQWIKQNYPKTKIAMGGGFANTELRSVSDARVFEFVDFITLDDGEAPIENLIEHIDGNRKLEELKRTFTCINGHVMFVNNNSCADYKQHELGTPDYSDFLLTEYISAIEIMNPMHRMWSDGRWNKLTMAHGCYWGKCTFCDVSLPYIKDYEPATAQLICDRMETLMQQTGENGFHFVDEAAPPALMRALAIEILKRRLVVSWWTNIRFEKSFTLDLCLLLKASGCIAVSGGLEVASDRLLTLIDKGITVAQVAKVNKHFTEAGIMVHAYLMYGFPTQTAQETIDSLEMVRQMFQTGILQSGYWHQFAMTAHSPVGLHPAKYKVKRVNELVGSFANNDLEHEDPTGADHETFSFGLKKSLLNFMYGACLDKPLQSWFDMKVPKTTVAPDYIAKALKEVEMISHKPSTKIVWLGVQPSVENFVQSKNGMQREMVSISFYAKKETHKITLPKDNGEWLMQQLPKLSIVNETVMTLKDLQADYEANGLENFELFWDNKPVRTLHKVGLLRL
jgi:radical SAM superfamily enzyme YgiQ (UPF0313 family)